MPPLIKLKTLIFSFLLLLWLFFIPLASVVYTPWTYATNCQWNLRCEQLGSTKTDIASHELASFFRHQLHTLPSPPWSEKEIRHLTEVRGMYDQAFWLFILISIVFVLDFVFSRRSSRLQRYQTYAVISRNLMLGLLILMLVISPFFRFFWMEVFHPLVFSNQLWRTDPLDISWYLMPSHYFLWVIIFLLATTLLLSQILVWLVSKFIKQFIDQSLK